MHCHVTTRTAVLDDLSVGGSFGEKSLRFLFSAQVRPRSCQEAGQPRMALQSGSAKHAEPRRRAGLEETLRSDPCTTDGGRRKGDGIGPPNRQVCAVHGIGSWNQWLDKPPLQYGIATAGKGSQHHIDTRPETRDPCSQVYHPMRPPTDPAQDPKDRKQTQTRHLQLRLDGLLRRRGVRIHQHLARPFAVPEEDDLHGQVVPVPP